MKVKAKDLKANVGIASAAILSDKLMTRADLARFLQVTTRTVDNMRKRGLPTMMVGSSPRFERVSVTTWLAAQKGAEA